MSFSLDDLRSMSEPDEAGCWIWQRGRTTNGYGMAWCDGKQLGAHRVAAALAHGPCPDGQEVMHLCDVRACVNPDHLSYGTRAENLAHMWEAGRGVRSLGEKCGKSRLTAAGVLEIRRMRETGSTQKVIADTFGVSKSTIAAVLRGRTWQHV